MGGIDSFSHCMNNKQRAGKKSIGARARKLGELWSMLEKFWSVLEINIEESGC